MNIIALADIMTVNIPPLTYCIYDAKFMYQCRRLMTYRGKL